MSEAQENQKPNNEEAESSEREDLRSARVLRNSEYIDIGISRSEYRLLLEIERVRGGVKETEARLRLEIEKVRAEIKETESRLRSDLKDTDLKIEQVRAETEKVRAEIKETEARLRLEIERSKNWIVTWIVITNIALAALIIAAIKLL